MKNAIWSMDEMRFSPQIIDSIGLKCMLIILSRNVSNSHTKSRSQQNINKALLQKIRTKHPTPISSHLFQFSGRIDTPSRLSPAVDCSPFR